jgi:hypothetical protein
VLDAVARATALTNVTVSASRGPGPGPGADHVDAAPGGRHGVCPCGPAAGTPAVDGERPAPFAPVAAGRSLRAGGRAPTLSGRCAAGSADDDTGQEAHSASTPCAPPKPPRCGSKDYTDTLRGHRVLYLIGKGNKPATMPLTVPALRVLGACRGQRPAASGTAGRWCCDRSQASRSTDATPTAWSPGSRQPPASHGTSTPVAAARRQSPTSSTPASPCATQILARHYDRARGNLDRHGVQRRLGPD